MLHSMSHQGLLFNGSFILIYSLNAARKFYFSFQDDEIFVQLDELDELDRIAHA